MPGTLSLHGNAAMTLLLLPVCCVFKHLYQYPITHLLPSLYTHPLPVPYPPFLLPTPPPNPPVARGACMV